MHYAHVQTLMSATVGKAHVNNIARTLQAPTAVVVELDLDLASTVTLAMVWYYNIIPVYLY
jgi:hypothetical protein